MCPVASDVNTVSHTSKGVTYNSLQRTRFPPGGAVLLQVYGWPRRFAPRETSHPRAAPLVFAERGDGHNRSQTSAGLRERACLKNRVPSR